MSAHLASKTGRVAAGGSLLVGGIAGALVLAPQAGAATTFTVTTTADSGAGSLRQAIDDANTTLGADIIVFDASSAGTITLTTGEIYITDDVTITGLGAADSIISGNNASSIFYIYNVAASLTVSISGLTMTDGYSVKDGGAIANWGNDLTLSSVVLTGNETTGSGGAIHSQYAASPNTDRNAPLTVIDSEISDNTAGSSGGGLSLKEMGNVTITNSVISGNTAGDGGGGLYTNETGDITIDSSTFDQNTSPDDGGGLYATYTDSFTMTNSTVSGNTSIDGAGIELGYNGDVLIVNSTIANNVGNPTRGDGGALYSWGSSGNVRIMFSTISGNSTVNSTVRLSGLDDFGVEITGTLISDNTTTEGSGTLAVDLFLNGSIATVSDSLIMGTTAGAPFFDGGGNVAGVSAQLGILADNGGATFTMEPAAGSPAIDAGPLTWTAFTGDGFDQRATPYVRVYNGQSDMGAFEVQPEPVPPTTTTTVAPIDTTTTVATDPVVPAFTG